MTPLRSLFRSLHDRHGRPVRLAVMLLAGLVAWGAVMADRPARAQTLGIAAVVNDGVITMLDLRARIELTLLTSGLPPSDEQRQRLIQPVLRELIDEELQRQKIEEAGIEIEDRFVAEAIAETEAQNNLQPGQLGQIMASRGIPFEILQEQIRTRLGWLRLVGRQFRRLAEISSEEVEEVYRNLQETADQEQERLSEILLQVSTPADEPEVRAFAERLVEQLRGGASFDGLAQQFSASPTAQFGGELGWVSRDVMNDDLLSVVPDLAPGEVSDPVRTLSGYLIVKLEERGSPFANNRQPTSLDIAQVFLPTRADDADLSPEAQSAKLERVVDEAASCSDMERLAEELNSPVAADLGTVTPGDLVGDIRAAVVDLPVGQPSRIIELSSGLMVAMVCNREGGGMVLPSRADIEERLRTRKLNVFGRRLLRDARRESFIDVRI